MTNIIPDALTVSTLRPLAFRGLGRGAATRPPEFYVLRHELGHLFGAQHDRDARDGVARSKRSSAAAMRFTSMKRQRSWLRFWLTIMSVREGGKWCPNPQDCIGMPQTALRWGAAE